MELMPWKIPILVVFDPLSLSVSLGVGVVQNNHENAVKLGW